MTRTVRMFGLQKALMEVLLQGQPGALPPRWRWGRLVDELVSDSGRVDPGRESLDHGQPDAAAQPWDVKGVKIPGGTPSNPKFAAMLPAFPRTLRKSSKGCSMLAPGGHHGRGGSRKFIVDVDNALLIEDQYFVSPATGPGPKT